MKVRWGKAKCLSRVIVLLESRYVSSREGWEGDQMSLRAFCKSISVIGKGQQLFLRGTGLPEVSEEYRYSCCGSQRMPPIGGSWVSAGERGRKDHPPQPGYQLSGCKWDGWSRRSHTLKLLGNCCWNPVCIWLLLFIFIHTSPHTDFSP